MKTLFIGNSYTFYNDLPGMLRQLSQARGKELITASVTSGGKNLEWHWYNPETLDTLTQPGWDRVVLQEHSLGAVEEPEKMSSAAAKFNSRIRLAGAEPILYVTWARQHIPEMQTAINETYTRVAREIGARLAPVGPAWAMALRNARELPLYTDDRSHPSVLGTYLAACVFYATLFEESPLGLSNRFQSSSHVTSVIDKGIAGVLQDAAWASVHMTTGSGLHI